MTTTVIINAHCNSDTEVVIKTTDAEWEKATGTPFKDVVIQNGEIHQCHVYDNRLVTVREVKKEKL